MGASGLIVADLADALAHAWDAELAGLNGTFSLSLRAPGLTVTRLPDAEHYAASTMKLAVLGAVAHTGTTGTITVHRRFLGATSGTFDMQQSDDQDDWTWDRLGQDLDVATLVEQMITVSSNIATNLLLERIGIGAISAYLLRLGLGDALRVGRLIGDTAAQDQGVTNTVTAAGLAELMTSLTSGPTARDTTDVLARQTHLDMIPAGLPAGTWSASKSGWVTGVKHDVALVRPEGAPAYVLAVCTTADLPHLDGQHLVARLSAVTWEHWTRWHAS